MVREGARTRTSEVWYGGGGLGPVGSLYGEEGPCMVKGVPVCPL